jgi:hypothetical protein
MVENEQKEWWNDEAKPKISPKKWEESLGNFHELVFKLVENSVNAICNQEDEEFIRQTIKKHFINVNKFAYRITLCESWMDQDILKSTCNDFYNTIDNGVMMSEHFEAADNQVVKFKRKTFSNTAKMYVLKMMDQVEIS